MGASSWHDESYQGNPSYVHTVCNEGAIHSLEITKYNKYSLSFCFLVLMKISSCLHGRKPGRQSWNGCTVSVGKCFSERSYICSLMGYVNANKGFHFFRLSISKRKLEIEEMILSLYLWIIHAESRGGKKECIIFGFRVLLLKAVHIFIPTGLLGNFILFLLLSNSFVNTFF